MVFEPSPTQTCGICFVECTESWSCSSASHTFCVQCMQAYLRDRIAAFRFDFVCPGSCTHSMSEADLQLFLSAEELALATKRKQLQQNKNLRECPGCHNLLEGSLQSPDMLCGCGQSFCFLHELGHVGNKCRTKGPGVWQRATTRVWTAVHTRECPKCHNHIQKNGGCNHMTCRCGHEICWACGRDYVWPDGRRGHNFKLFPSPSELKYCCNNWKQWGKRAGVLVAAPPAAGVILGAAAAVAGVAAPVLLVGGIGYGAYIVYENQKYKRQRARRARQAQQERLEALEQARRRQDIAQRQVLALHAQRQEEERKRKAEQQQRQAKQEAEAKLQHALNFPDVSLEELTRMIEQSLAAPSQSMITTPPPASSPHTIFLFNTGLSSLESTA